MGYYVKSTYPCTNFQNCAFKGMKGGCHFTWTNCEICEAGYTGEKCESGLCSDVNRMEFVG